MATSKIWNRNNLLVVLFGCFMLVGLTALAWIGTPPTVEAVGQKLPKLDLQPLVGADAAPTLESLSGKVAVIHFWGTWCPPCVKEFPEFAELYQRFAEDPRVAVVSVSCSSGPEFDLEALQRDTEAFLQEQPQSLPTYCDPVAMTRGQLALILPNGSLSYPTTLLVDQQGIIVASLIGTAPGDMESLEQKIAELLE